MKVLKICNGCGRELDDHIKFCPKCGTDQSKNSIMTNTKTSKETSNVDDVTNKSLNEGRIVTVLGIVLIFFAMTLPVVEVNAMYRHAVFDLSTFSRPMSMIFQAVCILAVAGLVMKKYRLVTIAGSGFIFYFIGIMSVYIYLCFVSKIVFMNISFGTNLLCVGSLILTIGGVMCGRSTEPVYSAKIFDQWKHDLSYPITIGGINFVGIWMSIAIALILIACTFKAEIFRA